MSDDIVKFVMPDLSKAWLGTQVYETVSGFDSELGVLRDGATQDTVLVQKHKIVDDIQIEAIKRRIFDCFINTDKGGNAYSGEDAEKYVLDKVNTSRLFRTLIYPFERFNQNGIMYTVSELPEGFCEKYQNIGRAIRRTEFPFHYRIIASMNMAEAIMMLGTYFDGCLNRIALEAFYVNIENGDIKVVLDRVISDGDFNDTDDYEYLVIEKPQGETVDSSDLLRFAAYSAFRLICVESPYDGRRTLTEFPLLTRKTYKEINSGRYGFIFSETGCGFSEYINKEMLQKWNSIPGKVRDAFSVILNNEENDCINMEQWLKNMRVLRDCLVYVNGQFKLCDPGVSNGVSFMDSGEYSIPIWPKKALYWYHVGVDPDDVETEVIAGITPDGFMENRSNMQWVIDNESRLIVVHPGKSIKPDIGMDIEINNVHFKVVSGEKPLVTGVDSGSPPDNSALGGEHAIDIIHLDEV